MLRRYFFDHKPALVVTSRNIEAQLIPLLREVGINILEVHCYHPEFVEGEAELFLTDAHFAGLEAIYNYINSCRGHLKSVKDFGVADAT